MCASRAHAERGVCSRETSLSWLCTIRDLLAFLHARQSVPQCQELLAAERGGTQFLIRSDDDLPLIECPRRLAGQRDSVEADTVL